MSDTITPMLKHGLHKPYALDWGELNERIQSQSIQSGIQDKATEAVHKRTKHYSICRNCTHNTTCSDAYYERIKCKRKKVTPTYTD